MENMKKYESLKSIIIVLFVILPVLLFSQSIINPLSLKNRNQIIKVIAKYDDDGVLLRWGTTKSGAWLMGTQYGYNITRGEFDIKDDTAVLVNHKVLTSSSIMPWTVDRFKTAYEKDTMNKNLLVALECIHDKWHSISIEDGGSFIEQADELSNRYGFDLFVSDLNLETAFASGLAFRDSTTEEGKNYMYRITIPVSPDIYIVDTAYIYVQTTEKYQLPRPKIFSGIEDEHHIVINLDRELHNRSFTAYDIERSKDGINFIKLNEQPFVHGLSEDSTLYSPYISYIDSVQNYIPYHYRIIGYTPFGEKSTFSDTIILMGRDKTPAGQPENVKADYLEGKGMQITWTFDGDYEDLEGFRVTKSQEFSGPFNLISDSLLSKETFSFLDPEANKLRPETYIVESIDTAGNIQGSLPAYGNVIDSIPPTQPLELTGEIDSTGIVTLHWKKNPEEDVIGYQVYFANSKKNVFAQITSGPYDSLLFIDTVSLNTLTRHVYYRITAVDFRYNISPFSDILELERPDIIPPNSPVFTNYKINEKGVLITWALSSSNDVDYHLLSRKSENDTIWTDILKFTDDKTIYFDTTISPNINYEYKIIAFDKSGLKSDIVRNLNITSPDFKIKKSVDSFDYEIIKKDILLKWNSNQKNIYAFVIYRMDKNHPLQRIATLKAVENKYLDKNLKRNIKYQYIIKIIFKDGKESDFSDKLIIKI